MSDAGNDEIRALKDEIRDLIRINNEYSISNWHLAIAVWGTSITLLVASIVLRIKC